MAALGPQQVARLFSDGAADRIALYALRNVTTGDVRDLAGDFLSIKAAIILGASVMNVLSCVVAGTSVTIPAGMAGDSGYLTVIGSSSGSAD